MDRFYIDKYTGKITHNDIYLVDVTAKDGTVYEKLEPRRLFPFSNPNRYISLVDAGENEIAFVRDYDELDEDSRKALDKCFEEYYFIPIIDKILSVYDNMRDRLYWTASTDRGIIRLEIKNCVNDIKYNTDTGRILIRDRNDNRYIITDYNKLDKNSRRLIVSYI